MQEPDWLSGARSVSGLIPASFFKLNGSFQHLSLQFGKCKPIPWLVSSKKLGRLQLPANSYRGWEGQEDGDGRLGQRYGVNKYKTPFYL